jgi:hypothetical protein
MHWVGPVLAIPQMNCIYRSGSKNLPFDDSEMEATVVDQKIE